jgi:phosphopantothenoylcysteine decarboxylase/phosphopantothenate--cysteine ligase
VAERGAQKVKKRPGEPPPPLALAENPDILKGLSAPGPTRPQLVVGFAAETEEVARHAAEKRARKGCDWILANDVSEGTETFGGADNQVTLVTDAGADAWPRASKQQVAERLARRIADHFSRAERDAAE